MNFFKSEKIFRSEESEKIEEILKKIEPLTLKIEAEKRAEDLILRRAAAEAIERLRKEQLEILPGLRETVKDKEAAYLKVKADLEAANEELRMARAALLRRTGDFNTDIMLQEQILCGTYDPAVDGAIIFFQRQLDFLRSPGRISVDTRGTERNLFTERKKITVESNESAILSAMEYCMAGIKELEKMKFIPQLDLQKIEQLKAGTPKIDALDQFTAEKPFRKINTNPPRKTDSQIEWELGKLKEKFQKVMGKPW